MGDRVNGLGPGFWSGPVVARALARCDFAVLMEQIRREHGWTQAELARAVGYSQSWVSKVLRERQVLTLDQAREVARRLEMPVHLLRFGGPGGEDQAKRREFGKAVVLAAVSWPALDAIGCDASPTLTMITSAQRRLDATTPARETVRSVVAHVEMANRLTARASTPQSAARLAAALSEAAGFAGWLHADMCDFGTARSYYRLAVDAARRAEHDLLACYMLGSLAALEIDQGDHVTGLAFVARARQQITGTPHPTPQAWLAATEALGHAASRGDAGAAGRALEQAAEATARVDLVASVPWPWLSAFDQAKLEGYRALVNVRLGRPSEALAAFAESLASAQPVQKQRAVIMLEVATAVSLEGTAHKDATRTDEAFRLASEALAAGMHYGSERVIQRSRRFRRDYAGPITPQVRDFDRRLQAALI